MTDQDKTTVSFEAVNGRPLGELGPLDQVAVGPEDGRKILFDAARVVTAEGDPITEAPDGATELVGGARAVKLGGEVIAIAESGPDQS